MFVTKEREIISITIILKIGRNFTPPDLKRVFSTEYLRIFSEN
jgi:hypothetical protein